MRKSLTAFLGSLLVCTVLNAQLVSSPGDDAPFDIVFVLDRSSGAFDLSGNNIKSLGVDEAIRILTQYGDRISTAGVVSMADTAKLALPLTTANQALDFLNDLRLEYEDIYSTWDGIVFKDFEDMLYDQGAAFYTSIGRPNEFENIPEGLKLAIDSFASNSSLKRYIYAYVDVNEDATAVGDPTLIAAIKQWNSGSDYTKNRIWLHEEGNAGGPFKDLYKHEFNNDDHYYALNTGSFVGPFPTSIESGIVIKYMGRELLNPDMINGKQAVLTIESLGNLPIGSLATSIELIGSDQYDQNDLYGSWVASTSLGTDNKTLTVDVLLPGSYILTVQGTLPAGGYVYEQIRLNFTYDYDFVNLWCPTEDINEVTTYTPFQYLTIDLGVTSGNPLEIVMDLDVTLCDLDYEGGVSYSTEDIEIEMVSMLSSCVISYVDKPDAILGEKNIFLSGIPSTSPYANLVSFEFTLTCLPWIPKQLGDLNIFR